MNTCAHRLETFNNHDPPWPYGNNEYYHTPEEFANAGFYNIGTTTHQDKVQCYLCDITLADWKKGQSPLARHAHAASTCPLVFLNFPDALSTIPIIDTAPHTHPESDTMLKARLKTFSKGRVWPPLPVLQHTRSSTRHRSYPPATKMAEAGFVFLPTEGEPDRVKCPYCQQYFSGFNKASNPWTQHQRQSPNCVFVTRWQAKLPPKRSLIPQKRNGPTERGKRSLPITTSSSIPKSNRRATTGGAKRTAKATQEHDDDDDDDDNDDNEENINSEEGNNNDDNGGQEKSRFDDSIWDIAKMQLNLKPHTDRTKPTTDSQQHSSKPLITYVPKKKAHKKFKKILPPALTKPSHTIVSQNQNTQPISDKEARSTQKQPVQGKPSVKGKEKATEPLASPPLSNRTVHGSRSSTTSDIFRAPMGALPHSTPKNSRIDHGYDLMALTLSPIRSTGPALNRNGIGNAFGNLDTPMRSHINTNDDEDVSKQIEWRFKKGRAGSSSSRQLPSTPLLDFDDDDNEGPGLGITTMLSEQELAMTVEQYLHAMMEHKVAHVEQQGAAMIKAIRDEVEHTKKSILLPHPHVV